MKFDGVRLMSLGIIKLGMPAFAGHVDDAIFLEYSNPTTSITSLDVISRSEATRNLAINQIVKDFSLRSK
jgi:hypothetical protein